MIEDLDMIHYEILKEPEGRDKSTPSVPTQTTTIDESFTPKSKLFNKTVFKKAF